MGEVVDIKPVKLHENHEFVTDCVRFHEQLVTEAWMKLKYGFANEVWDRLGDDTALLMAVEDEKIRRTHSGASKREKAQKLVVAAPEVMSKILLDESQSARHRIDSAKTLNDFAQNPQDHSPASAGFFQISINLGADVDGKPVIEHYKKSLTIDVNNGDGTDAPRRPLPAANKWDDGDVVPARTGYQLQDYEPVARASDRPTSDRPTVARAATVKPGKAVKRRTSVHETGVRETSSPLEDQLTAAQQLALESLMSFEE